MATTLRHPAVTEQVRFQVHVRAVPARNPLRWLTILVVVWALSGIYEGTHLKRGFIPWDGGAYAQSAERVLHGQLPHRDFVEVYTGGLTYLNAAAMRIFGVNFAAERMMLFVFFLAWIPALYWIATQFCRNWMAGGLVLLAVAWSVPNYSEAVPSWYNLFFATFGIAALLAYIKRPGWEWLVAAGICGGLSFLAKSVGLCYVAGVLLFFLFREQCLWRASMGGASWSKSRDPKTAIARPDGAGENLMPEDPPFATAAKDGAPAEAQDKSGASIGVGTTPAYTIFVWVGLTLFLALLVRMIAPLIGEGAGEFVLFVLPELALCVAIAWTEWEVRRRAGPGSWRRFANLLRMAIPFAIGVILPIVVFLVPFVRAQATGALIHELFAQASARIATANKIPYEIATIIPAIAIFAAVVLSGWLRGLARRVFLFCFIALFVTGVVLVFTTWFYPSDVYQALWSAAYWLTPLLVIAGVVMVIQAARRGGAEWRSRGNSPGATNEVELVLAPDSRGAVEFANASPRDLGSLQPVFLLLAVTTLCSLVEFPYSAPTYFCYIAPLVILCAAALMRRFPRISRELLAAFAVGFFLFMVFAATPGFIYVLGNGRRPDVQKYAINSERAGGLRVDPESADVYNQLIPLVRAHAGTGEIYAAPDCPEVYFLSGYKNLTPDIYDFLDPASRDGRKIRAMVANPRVRVVVVNTDPALSPPLAWDVVASIEREFPESEMAGAFEVRWR